MKRPNLFLVGCPRSGTTSLYQLLHSHPDIYMSSIKGPNYFGNKPNKAFPQYHKNRELYLALYKNREEKWLGDASHYFSSETAPKEINEFSAKSKILISLRKPVDLAVSYYKMGFIPNKGLLKDSLKKTEDKGVKELKQDLNYSSNVERYFKTFGRKNVKVILFLDLKNNPNKVKQEIARFLNINPKLFGNVYKTNSSKELKNKWIKKGINAMTPETRIAIKKMLPKRVVIKLQKSIEHFTAGNEIKVESQEIPKGLIEKNNLEARNLGGLIKKDVNYWIVR